MKTEQESVDICRYDTVYEVITSILKSLLTIDEMKKMIRSISNYVEAEEQYMRRKNDHIKTNRDS